MGVLTVEPTPLTLAQIADVAFGATKVQLSDTTRRIVAESRQVVDRIVQNHVVTYGINTGFGRLADVHIPDDELRQLQLNLVRSHAVGVGEPLSIPETRAMMLLRLNVLAQGFSGARVEVLEFLVEMLNKRITPVVPSQGSVGASGDLAPLAHLALAMIGEGECWSGSTRIPARKALEKQGLTQLALEPKEGLALLNGTQAIGGVGCLGLIRALRCVHAADIIGAMTLEALMGTPTAFDLRIHEARRHEGQIASAKHLLGLMEGSEIRESHRVGDSRVQDAYCLRCMPQVHGAVRSALRHVRETLEQETGAATDNPLVFRENGDVISGGNFHGAPLAYALDYAAIVMTDLLSISERRMDRLVNPDANEGLPAFLSGHPGTGSGFMMPHVTVAALLNDCKVLSHPASVDSVPTSGGKEDHVSMGMTSALKFRRIVDNVERGLAIELLTAAEGLEYRRPLRAGATIERAHETVRVALDIPRVQRDRYLAPDFEAIAAAIGRGAFDSGLETIL
ncbi:MAG: histidine ammonia-lyase [Armatimonadetes bacterium]|nr:histidine ammonia-lyase [Armatimonadota bacterium]